MVDGAVVRALSKLRCNSSSNSSQEICPLDVGAAGTVGFGVDIGAGVVGVAAGAAGTVGFGVDIDAGAVGVGAGVAGTVGFGVDIDAGAVGVGAGVAGAADTAGVVSLGAGAAGKGDDNGFGFSDKDDGRSNVPPVTAPGTCIVGVAIFDGFGGVGGSAERKNFKKLGNLALFFSM